MPLPAALAARLAKRGIISKSSERKAEEVEEVFAWDYDEAHPTNGAPEQKEVEEEPESGADIDGELVHEEVACPNTNNPFHTCSQYCIKRWGYKQWTPDDKMAGRRERLLRKHPLPDTWLEVGDPNTGRYYYWNTETDEVSWLPPSHPKSKISLSAEKLIEVIQGAEGVRQSSDDDRGDREKRRQREEEEMEEDVPDISQQEDDLDVDEHDFEKMEEEIMKERQKEKKRERRGRRGGGGGGGGGAAAEALDPMDPASYSDIPRGNWSSGLDLPGSAKTGVDATASGPLFQQRPYPSPGAVLKMNRQLPTE